MDDGGNGLGSSVQVGCRGWFVQRGRAKMGKREIGLIDLVLIFFISYFLFFFMKRKIFHI